MQRNGATIAAVCAASVKVHGLLQIAGNGRWWWDVCEGQGAGGLGRVGRFLHAGKFVECIHHERAAAAEGK